jgi:hypothetical protein
MAQLFFENTIFTQLYGLNLESWEQTTLNNEKEIVS